MIVYDVFMVGCLIMGAFFFLGLYLHYLGAHHVAPCLDIYTAQ